ncbi:MULTISPECIES: FxLYD domain-containing protein [Burkholderia cepacia complex]|uniref:FxLYD domain-containing protein n=1 Tax=Burkholderia cepacia complex TaxID=87882 RepID=UPI000A913B6B|nr:MULTISPECIES: FxLYD domain-containing protein [Burkholderia cepacia complex]
MNIWFFAAALALSAVCGAYAKRRGRSGGKWFAIAVVASPLIAAILLLVLENKSPNPTASNKDLGLAAALILVALVYFGANFSNSEKVSKESVVSAAGNQGAEASPSSNSDDRFTITDLRLTSGEYGSLNISGMLTNNTDRQYSYVQVELNAYDKSGAQIGSDIVNVNNLESRGHWKFKTPLLQQDVDTVKVKGVTAF